ncbi:phosphoribosylanthranilate isomerase [Paralimibaculum aggregatum]|uniref:N-(5'-phosphoribosyl)anthranilate isomerase n=1 Tax=Paralimibaculum aggregatum TaxID=3036245 RepID=A0ABQ6LK52_9RHOB|nr:phosphoribosylanthranilate isomerase [Limibaculum sp. NKW23]GMG81158.1 phosphoribosylanthranilate isomerase [Limibaculum sp. NKW23]
MRRIRVKICCIASPEEAHLAAGAGADLLGLVGPMPSGPGTLSLAEAGRIARTAPPWARPVLLTAAETAAAIAGEARAAGVDTVQVVRHIAPAEAARLAATGLHAIQVIHVEGPEALRLIPAYAPHVAAFLLDSGRPSEGALGGTGRVHDWQVSRAFVLQSPKPVFLAGGLGPENAQRAILEVRPFGLDICSGLRRGAAKALDPERLSAFMAAVGEAANMLAASPGDG